jgi:hypothetical protein
MATVQEGVTAYPFDFEGLIYFGDDLIRVGEYESAQLLFNRVLDLDAPLTALMISILGRLDYALDDCTSATPKLENLPFYSFNVLYLAGCYAEADRKADALAMLDKARDSFGIHSPADFPPEFRNMPGVTERLTDQLARVGWPE